VLATVVIGALGACSSDDEPQITRAAYVKQAKAICADTRDAIEKEAADLDGDDPNALPDYVSYASAEFLDELEALRELGYPAGSEERLKNAYDVLEQRFTRWQADPSLATEGKADTELNSATQTLKDLGLTVCAPTV